MTKQKLYIRKPMFSNGRWVVQISTGISPLSEIVETVPCSGREAAWSTYKRLMKEKGASY